MDQTINNYQAQVLDQIRHLKGDACQLYTDDLLESEIYSINIRIPEEISQTIKAVSDDICKEFPNQFYYPPSLYHFTVLARIPITFPEDQLITSITSARKRYPFKLVLQGIGAATRGVSIPGYDRNANIFQLRTALRNSVGQADDYTKYHPVWENILWINFIRYRQKPPDEFFTYIQKFNDAIYGEITNPPFYLYTNQSQTLDPKLSKLISVFD
jgi:hypothetical protein